MAIAYGDFIGALRARLSFRPLIYGYSNARMRAMRTGLLTRRQAEDLLKVKTPAAVAEYLSRTSYREDFERMPAHITDEERIELAISRNFARTARKILRITPEQSKQTLRALLGRYDIHNFKSILLARRIGRGAEETMRLLIPAGSLSRAELERMAGAKSPEELYEALRATSFGSQFLSSESARRLPREQLKAALHAKGTEQERLDELMNALDSYYYESASQAAQAGERDSELLTDFARSETDAKNAMTIMRMRKAGADRRAIAKSLVPGGNFTHAQLDRMASAKDIGAIAEMASSFFRSKTGKGEFESAQTRYGEDGNLSHFEVAFENSLARRSLKVMRRSMMSVGAIAGFFFLKEEEMNNIRKVVRGKALGLPPERIAEMLVIVG